MPKPVGARSMQRFLSLARLFGRDERGVFAVLFGLMAIVLVALAGAVVDYIALEQTRNRAQIALDAAALALQPMIFEEPLNTADIRAKAQALLRDRLGIVNETGQFGVEAEIADIQVNVADGSLLLVADMEMPTYFVSLVGVQAMSAKVRSEATRKKLALEVAFVLDNSGSMSYTGTGSNGTRQRILFLKDAATCAVNILFYKDVTDSLDTCVPAAGATKLEDVKVSVVPFTMFVNVGAGNANAAWMDTTGASAIHNDNFDNDDDENTAPTVALPTRQALFTATGEAWRGCVEARPHIKTGTLATEYLDTDDTVPVAGNTRFVPLFSPDAANTIGGNNYITNESPAICDRPSTSPIHTTCTYSERRTCNSNGGNCGATTATQVPSGPVNFSSNQKYAGGYYGAHSQTCDCRSWTSLTAWEDQTKSGNSRVFQRTRTCAGADGGGYIPTGLSARENFERTCKYRQTVSGSSFSWGPNADCTRTAILPLTDVPATAINTINGMIAEGGTNIHEGTVWGFRALSPTQPFNQGAPYDEATSKVLIVMTDGENTAYNLPPPANPSYCDATRAGFNGSCYNSAYGFPYNSKNTNANSTSGGNVERLGHNGANNATLVATMNERTRQTCENAKAAGITVYTIGLATNQASQSTQAEVEDMLADCASTRDKAHFPQTPGALKQVFQDIANDLSALRLAQ